MDADFWHRRWQQGETGWHRDEIDLHLREHWPPPGLSPGARVFVPLCGKSLDLLWLAGEGHRVLGVEISPIAVEAFFKDNGLVPLVTEEPPFQRFKADEIEILCGDFFKLTPAQITDVDAVYDRASLIALPPEMREHYADLLLRLLRSGTSIFLITLEYDPGEMAGPPFSVAEPEVRALLGESFELQRLARHDVLAENPQFQQRGLSDLFEGVYTLRSRGSR